MSFSSPGFDEFRPLSDLLGEPASDTETGNPIQSTDYARKPSAFSPGRSTFFLRHDNPLDLAIDNLGLGLYHYIILFVCILATAGVLSIGFIPAFIALSTMVQSMRITPQSFGVFMAIQSVLTAFVTFTVGALSDTYGRRRIFLATMLITSISSLFCVTANNLVDFYIVLSIPMAISTAALVLTPTYFMELCPAATRGRFAIASTMIGGLGYVYAAVFGLAFLRNHRQDISGGGWTYWKYFLLSMTFPFWICCLLLSMFGFESPRFLFKSNQTSDARDVLNQIAAMNGCDFRVIPSLDSFVSYSDVFLKDLPAFDIKSAVLTFLNEQHSKYATIATICGTIGFWTSISFFPFFLVDINQYTLDLAAGCVSVAYLIFLWCIVDHPQIGRITIGTILFGWNAFCFFPLMFSTNSVVRLTFMSAYIPSALAMLAVILILLAELYATEVRVFSIGIILGLSSLLNSLVYLGLGLSLSTAPVFAFPMFFCLLFGVGAWAMNKIDGDQTLRVMN